MDGVNKKPDRQDQQHQATNGQRARKRRQLVEQFLENAVELKAEQDLRAENEKAAFVESDFEFALKGHRRLR
jgi:hypothetical protein